MVKIIKTNNEDIIAVPFEDEVFQYELGTVNDWITYLDDGPEFVLEGIVMRPESIVSDVKEIREAINNSDDDSVYLDVDFKLSSTHTIKEYSNAKIEKLIDFCREKDIWIGWQLHRIGINLNRPFSEPHANDIYGYANRKIAELKELLDANSSSVDYADNDIWIIKDENLTVSVNIARSSATCEGKLYNKSFTLKTEPGFRGTVMNRLIISIDDIKEIGIDELNAFRNSIPLKAMELILEQKFSFRGGYGAVEFVFENGAYNLDKIANLIES